MSNLKLITFSILGKEEATLLSFSISYSLLPLQLTTYQDGLGLQMP